MISYSILTTLYKNDNPVFLKQSIDSMLNQTVLTNDYVIVKDGPLSQKLEQILKEYSRNYGFFNIINL